MSKTIEIASRHKGKIATKVKGESVTVEFKETDTPDVYLAMVDNDTAGSFLAIGRPDYWKPGVDAGTTEEGKSEKEKTEKEAVYTTTPVLPCSTTHVGFGKWQILDANGAIFAEDLSKKEAAEKAVELNTAE